MLQQFKIFDHLLNINTYFFYKLLEKKAKIYHRLVINETAMQVFFFLLYRMYNIQYCFSTNAKTTLQEDFYKTRVFCTVCIFYGPSPKTSLLMKRVECYQYGVIAHHLPTAVRVCFIQSISLLPWSCCIAMHTSWSSNIIQ